MDVAACYGAYPTAVTPRDGTNSVSPSAIPATTIDVSCGSGSITATLTPDSGAPTSVTMDVSTGGVVWLSELTLEADTSYTLSVTPSDPYMGGLTSVFSTGSAPLDALTGTPSVSVDGATLTVDGYATVTLNAAPVADPSGSQPAYDLLRDGNIVAGSIAGTTFFADSFSGEDGQEVCYSIRQYNADSSVYATSEEDCVELVMDEDTSHAGCFGREKRTSGGSVAAVLFGFGLLRRKRLGGGAS
jgi:hypothetical protein